jgi:hypothetical protein
MTDKITLTFVLAAVAALFVASCGGEGPAEGAIQSRTVETLSKPPAPDATSAERFGYTQRAQTAPSPPTGERTDAPPPGAPFEWTAPEGWREAPQRPMRVVSYAIGPNGEAECYIAVLGQGGGGIEANINRWRRQMGQEPLSDERIAALPRIEALGQQAPWVEISGQFTGQSGNVVEDAMLLGLVCPVADMSVFVKMIGPAEVVGDQRDNFLAFCNSLKWSEPANQ